MAVHTLVVPSQGDAAVFQFVKNPVGSPGSIAKFHCQGQSVQFVEQGGQIVAVFRRPGETRRKLQQNGRQLPGLGERCHAVPVPGDLPAPLAGVHLMG